MDVNKLKKTSKVLSISHYDFDGVSCAIVLANYFKNITFKSCTFTNIDKMLQNTDFSQYDAVFLTDCRPKNNSLLFLSNNIIVLDHHPQNEEDPVFGDNIFIVTENCAAVLVKNWVEATYNVDLSYLNTLLKYTDDYDRWIHHYKKSKMIECLFWKYGYFNFKDRFLKGYTRFLNTEVQYIREQMTEFNRIYDELEIFEIETINGCFVISDKFYNDIPDKLLTKENYKMVIIKNSKNGHISIRIRDNNVNIGSILKKLNIGGGHPQSGGLDKNYKDNSELFGVLSKLEKYIYDKVMDWRK